MSMTRSIAALSLVLAASASAWADIPPTIETLPDIKEILAGMAQDGGGPPKADPAPAQPQAKAPATLADLMSLSRERLEALYKGLPAGPIPDGDSRGRATLSAGTGFGAGSEKVLGVFWQGKIFRRRDDKHGELVNKILGAPLIKAEVYYDKSRLDGKESIILDYSGVPDLVIHGIRDEIRMAAPGLYVGYAYMRGPFGWTAKPLIFALDFNKKD